MKEAQRRIVQEVAGDGRWLAMGGPVTGSGGDGGGEERDGDAGGDGRLRDGVFFLETA
jgi:hypothetical protein